MNILIYNPAKALDGRPCVGCGLCVHVCSIKTKDGKAIRLAQISNYPYEIIIDAEDCVDCGKCEKACERHIVDYVILKRDDKCIGCGLCEEICPYSAIEIVKNKPEINLDLCTGCGNCAAACPSGALDMIVSSSEEVIGSIAVAIEKPSLQIGSRQKAQKD
jgi:ferredoxin